jgi:hypothetical protein
MRYLRLECSQLPSLRAKRSNPQQRAGRYGLLRRFAPRNDEKYDLILLAAF